MERSRIAALRFFAGLPEAELAAVASVAFEIEVASGQALSTDGDLGHALFAIETGSADVVIGDTTVRTIGTGDVVGEIAVLASPPDPFAPPEVAEGGRRTASVIATSAMRLVGLFKRDVWAMAQRAPLAAQRLRAKLDEHRAADERRAIDKQRSSPGADPLPPPS
jgi:CRP/FNR family transcriptional regulator, cyclic AMP receptor protein